MRESFFWLPVRSSVEREIVRFYRQRGRILGSLGTPLLFWVFLASGLGAAFPSNGLGQSYSQLFYPGIVLLTVLFTAIFSTISLIEDRHDGFLQGVLVAPVRAGALVAGKVLGGTILALLQGTLLLVAAPFVGYHCGLVGLAQVFLALAGVSLALTSVSFFFAWRLDSVQGFHSVMNLLLMPMWLLSGSFFPVERAPLWVQPLMYVNPLTYGLDAVRQGLTGAPGTLFGFAGDLAIVFLFGAIVWAFAAREVKRGAAA